MFHQIHFGILHKRGATDIEAVDLLGQTPFIHASAKGWLYAVEGLMRDPRVDINRADNSGRTALFWACVRGQLNVVQVAANKRIMASVTCPIKACLVTNSMTRVTIALVTIIHLATNMVTIIRL